MKVLVTGTSGFIGGHLALKLGGLGHDVLGIDSRDAPAAVAAVRTVKCDLLDARGLEQVISTFGPDALLHLAARTDLDGTGLEDYAANVTGVANLIAAIRSAGTVRRAICTSSQLVNEIGVVPKSDRHYSATTAYGRSKVETEQIWRSEDGAGTEWTIVRPTTIWGPRMNPHYLRFFRMLRRGHYFHVGRAPIFKSYGYVGNTVHQYERLMTAPADQLHGRTFYLADYVPVSLQAWSEAFRLALGGPPIRTMPAAAARALARIGDLVNRAGLHRFPFNSFRLNNVLTSYLMDLGATERVVGALPFTLEEGVEATAPWIAHAIGIPHAEAGRRDHTVQPR